MSKQPPAVGDRVEIETPDGLRTGVVDLVMPTNRQFAVILDEEFWVYRSVRGVGSIPTGTRYIEMTDSGGWRVIDG